MADVALHDCVHCGSCADPDHCVWGVTCPVCGAGPSEQCRRPGGLAPLHRERWTAARADRKESPVPDLLDKYEDPDLMDFEPLFSPEAQSCFNPGDRVYDKQTLREGVYVGRLRRYGDVAVVSLDGDGEATEMSFADLKQVYL